MLVRGCIETYVHLALYILIMLVGFTSFLSFYI